MSLKLITNREALTLRAQALERECGQMPHNSIGQELQTFVQDLMLFLLDVGLDKTGVALTVIDYLKEQQRNSSIGQPNNDS